MTIRRKDGHARAYVKDGTAYVLAASEYENVRLSWMAGKAFVETRGAHGEPITLKLAEVQGVSLLTAETWESIQQDNAADAREEKQREMLDD